MFIFAQLVGILIAAAGLAIALKPQVSMAMVAFWEQDKRIYWGGLIRFLFAGIMIVAAPDARVPAAILLLGILFLISGILVYALPDEKILAIIGWYKKLPAVAARVWGMVACVLGLLIVFWV